MFAEDYDRESEAEFTFYDLIIRGALKKIIGGTNPLRKEMRMLKVYYVRKSNYFGIVNQVNRLCKYIGIEKRRSKARGIPDIYVSKYRYNDLNIKLDKDEQEIAIMLGNFPWPYW